jgi:hypothetical protein
MSLDIYPAPALTSIIQSNLWIDATPEARMIGFTQKVEISQGLHDALRHIQYEEEYDSEQRLYDSIWLAHHYLGLEQRSSFSFTFDFLHNDLVAARMTESSLRLHVGMCGSTVSLGWLEDFPNRLHSP